MFYKVDKSGVAEAIAKMQQTETFHANFNSHMKDLQTQLQTAAEPLKTILMMQLECGYKAFML